VDITHPHSCAADQPEAEQPQISGFSALSSLTALTLRRSPFSVEVLPQPLSILHPLAALSDLVRLRISTPFTPPKNSEASRCTRSHHPSPVAVLPPMPHLTELTLDCRAAFDAQTLHSTTSNCPALRTLRLFGRSLCLQNQLTAITGLHMLTRIAFGEQFFNDSSLLQPPAGASSFQPRRAAASAVRGSFTPAFRRALSALLPARGGSLQVLQTEGPLAAHARRLLEGSRMFSGLLLRTGKVDTSVWSGALRLAHLLAA
jgi:hypothetical protein